MAKGSHSNRGYTTRSLGDTQLGLSFNSTWDEGFRMYDIRPYMMKYAETASYRLHIKMYQESYVKHTPAMEYYTTNK